MYKKRKRERKKEELYWYKNLEGDRAKGDVLKFKTLRKEGRSMGNRQAELAVPPASAT